MLLIVLSAHLWYLHIAKTEAILTFSTIGVRLETMIFVVLDGLLLACGLYHALNGLYTVLVDFGVKARTSITVLMYIVGFSLFGMGMYSLMIFIS